MINSQDFLANFIAIGSKASAITKMIRNEKSLFNLLIEEKNATEYLRSDYKTFADVLIQETVRNDLKIMHPDMGDHLYGEENNEFTNKLNVMIQIKIGSTEYETTDLILKVLDGHRDLASKLSSLIHRDISEFVTDGLRSNLSVLRQLDIDMDDLGMWIDPIDSTAEYISGVGHDDQKVIMDDVDSIRCVTVLLGAFSLKTGIPFAGVVYQPFSCRDSDGHWKHECYWGFSKGGTTVHSESIRVRELTYPAFAVSSKGERQYFSKILNNNEMVGKWNVGNNAGAGYKFLLMLEGKCDMYILSKGSTYMWDTCGPHAVLLAIGGGVVDYQGLLLEVSNMGLGKDVKDNVIRSLLGKHQLTYGLLDNDHCNTSGFLAYSSVGVAVSVIRHFMGGC